MPQVGACRAGWLAGQDERAERRLECATGEQVFDAAVMIGLLAGRTRGNPAAEGGILPRLGEVAERVALSVERLLEGGTGDASLESRQSAGLIQIKQPAQAAHIEREDRDLPARGLICPTTLVPPP